MYQEHDVLREVLECARRDLKDSKDLPDQAAKDQLEDLRPHLSRLVSPKGYRIVSKQSFFGRIASG
jgi:hypothetical protein